MLAWVFTKKSFFPPPCLSFVSSCSPSQKKFQNDNATFPQTAWQGFFLQQPSLIRCTSFTSHHKSKGQKSCTASRNCQRKERKQDWIVISNHSPCSNTTCKQLRVWQHLLLQPPLLKKMPSTAAETARPLVQTWYFLLGNDSTLK